MKTPEKDESQQFFKIYKHESWDMLMTQYREETSFDQFKEFIHEPVLSTKDAGISSRVINHWTNEGLIEDPRGEGASSGWRKLSRLDLVWIAVLLELRSFGFPVKLLKRAYDTIFFLFGDKDKPYPALEMGVCLCLTRKPVQLIVVNDGWAEVVRPIDLKMSAGIGHLTSKSYITINLNQICESVLQGRGRAEFSFFEALSDQENKVIEMIRSGDIDSLEIILRDGQLHKLKKMLRGKAAPGDLEGLAKKIQYGEVTVKFSDGKIVLSEIVEAKKV